MWVLKLGAELAYDGELCTVVEIVEGAVLCRTRAGRIRRLRLVDILRPRREGGLAHIPGQVEPGGQTGPAGVSWVDATEAAWAAAHERADHVREVLTGYRSGVSAIARAGEPRAAYLPSLSMTRRLRAKAEELGHGHRTVARWVAQYKEGGEIALLDARSSRPGRSLARVDDRWLACAAEVIREQTTEAKIAKSIIIARIDARLKDAHGGEVVRSPSRSTAYKVLEELGRGTATFDGSTKRKRSNANRPLAPYGRLLAARPGQYVMLDTTPLNVFAIAPITGRWVSADLTVAIDLYSRCILGMRLTPGSTKSIDVAGVLMEACQPFDIPADWSPEAAWPFHGLPETVVVDPSRTRVPRFVRSGILPETIVVDHGAPYLSEHVTSACARLGISIQPARIYTPTDKSPVERFFRTLDTFLQELPGYKGADIAGRGQDAEGQAVYTVPQLERIIREWAATVYHLRPHDGLTDPGLPGVTLSPAERYAQGLAISGTLRMPTDRSVLLELLPVVKRQFNHYGVDINRLRYTGPIVAKYANRSRSVHAANGTDWPFLVNPDDLSHIYFHDPDDGSWHTLDWVGKRELDGPFSLDALEYAKKLAVAQGRASQTDDVVAELLADWGAGRALSPTERRMSARAAAHLDQKNDDPDGVWSLRTIQRLLEAELDLHAAKDITSPPAFNPTAAAGEAGDDDDEDELGDLPAPGYAFEPMEMM